MDNIGATAPPQTAAQGTGPTLAGLRDLWDYRDHRYSHRAISGRFSALSPAEAASIRAWRRHQLRSLPSTESIAGALLDVARWTPPAYDRNPGGRPGDEWAATAASWRLAPVVAGAV